MSKQFIALVGIVSCCAVAFLHHGGVAAEKPTKPEVDGETTFGDKIVLACVERTAGIERQSDSVPLKNAKLVKLGGRHFLRGTAVIPKGTAEDARYKWYNGVDTAIEWKSVYQIYVFTAEQYEQYEQYVAAQAPATE